MKNSKWIFVTLSFGLVLLMATTGVVAKKKQKRTHAKKSTVSVKVLKKSTGDTTINTREVSIPPKPTKLPRVVREEAIKDIRKAAGAETTSQPVPPASISLSPVAPVSGKSWYNMTRGWHYPAGISRNNQTPFSAISGMSDIEGRNVFHSYFLFNFETVAKKSYMLDCAVSSKDKKAKWILGGAFAGEVAAQRGHLIVGFVAEKNTTHITMAIESSLVGYLYSCDLTQVN